jgi:hypothetical protein
MVNARAWYAASIDDFRASTTEAILGALAKNGSFAMLETQRDDHHHGLLDLHH